MEQLAVSSFIIFMRVTGFLISLPGFGTIQIPMLARLNIAIAVTLLMLVINGFPSTDASIDLTKLFQVLLIEFIIGVALGMPIRFLFLIVQSLGEMITSLIGMSPLPGVAFSGEQPSTTISSLLHISSIVMLFATGTHLQLIVGLAQSYKSIPVHAEFDLGAFVQMINADLGYLFLVMIRLASPFIVYALVVNFASGLINKLTPQVPIYFVSAPFLITGGLVCLFILSDDIISGVMLEAIRLSSLLR